MIVFNLLVPHPAYADPYCWSTLQNMIYNSLGRFTFTLAAFMTYIPMLVGHNNYGKYLLSSKNVLFVSKCVYIVAIIHPVVIGLLYNTVQDGMHVTYNVVIFLGLGNVF